MITHSIPSHNDKSILQLEVREELLQQIKSYSAWLGMTPDNFLTQAALYFLSKDQDWLSQQRKLSAQ